MKTFTIFLLACAFLISCGPAEYKKDRQYVCSPTQRKKVTEFIQASIKNANNMSDEEMEDVIEQLERTGVRCNCSQVEVQLDGNFEIVNPVDSFNYYNY